MNLPDLDKRRIKTRYLNMNIIDPNERIETRYKLCSCGSILELSILISSQYSENSECGVDASGNTFLIPSSVKKYWKRKSKDIAGVQSIRCAKCNKIYRISSFKV